MADETTTVISGVEDLGELKRDVASHFRDQLRDARNAATKDSEAFDQIIFALERLGMYLKQEMGTLGSYKTHITEAARQSPLATDIPHRHPLWHAPFTRIYDLVWQSRNAALHEGAFARHLTARAVDLTIVLEDALMSGLFEVRDFMVRGPVCAS